MSIPKPPNLRNKVPKPPTPIPKPPMQIPPPPKPKDPLAFTRDDLHQIEKDWHLPKAIDMEEAVLGALLIDGKAIDIVAPILKPEAFYEVAYKVMYEAILAIHNRDNGGIDLLTVCNELKSMGTLELVGGDIAVVELTQKVSSSAHVEFHTRIILEKYMLRQLIASASFTLNEAYNNKPDVFSLIESIESNILNIFKTSISNGSVSSEDDALEELEQKVKAVKMGETPGVYTGIREFDEWGGGLQKRELITFAGRPGMGKTTAMLSIGAKCAFEKDIPLAVFSLEMSKTDLKGRLASRGLKIPYSKIRKGTVTEDEMKQIRFYYNYIDESCFHIVDKMNVHEKIVSKIRELVLKKSVKIVFIDYVQLIKLARRTSDKAGDLSIITQDLKALANELNIPIVILAQLNREVDKRPNKRPGLSDLKQSGSIEEDSDTVGFFYRPAYYEENNGMGLPDDVVGKAKFIIAKGRSTGTRDFWTFFDFINCDFRSY